MSAKYYIPLFMTVLFASTACVPGMANEAGPIFEESNAEVATPPADAVHDDFFFDYKNATGYADDCNITGDCNETDDCNITGDCNETDDCNITGDCNETDDCDITGDCNETDDCNITGDCNETDDCNITGDCNETDDCNITGDCNETDDCNITGDCNETDDCNITGDCNETDDCNITGDCNETDDCNITGDCNDTEVSDAADGTDGMFLKSSSSLKLVALCDGCPTEDSPKSSNAKGKGSSVSAGLLLLAGSTFLVLAVGLSAVLFLGRERQNAVVICDNEVMMEEVPRCLSDASFAVPVTQSSDEARP